MSELLDKDLARIVGAPAKPTGKPKEPPKPRPALTPEQKAVLNAKRKETLAARKAAVEAELAKIGDEKERKLHLLKLKEEARRKAAARDKLLRDKLSGTQDKRKARNAVIVALGLAVLENSQHFKSAETLKDIQRAVEAFGDNSDRAKRLKTLGTQGLKVVTQKVQEAHGKNQPAHQGQGGHQ